MTKKETIKWILIQFKAMGATRLQLAIEWVKMQTNANYLRHNWWLLTNED